MFVWEVRIQGRETSEACADRRVLRFGCPGNCENQHRAMVTRLQQLYIGNHEEKLTARQQGFDHDFWAGSPSDCTTKLYRVHVKPRSTMFDPRQRATSPIPAGVEIVARKTYLRETRGRRVAGSNTTSTMTRTCGQVLLTGPSG